MPKAKAAQGLASREMTPRGNGDVRLYLSRLSSKNREARDTASLRLSTCDGD